VARLCGLQIVLVNKKQYCQTDGVRWKGVIAIACEMSTLLQQPCTLSSQWWHQVGSHAALVWGWKSTPLPLNILFVRQSGFCFTHFQMLRQSPWWYPSVSLPLGFMV